MWVIPAGEQASKQGQGRYVRSLDRQRSFAPWRKTAGCHLTLKGTGHDDDLENDNLIRIFWLMFGLFNYHIQIEQKTRKVLALFTPRMYIPIDQEDEGKRMNEEQKFCSARWTKRSGPASVHTTPPAP